MFARIVGGVNLLFFGFLGGASSWVCLRDQHCTAWNLIAILMCLGLASLGAYLMLDGDPEDQNAKGV